jgi:uncharacterized Ntn-hydrolase superfamily protein
MTFSIVAFDSDSDSWGIAVASKFLAGGAVVPWGRTGAGAVATQAMADLSYGPDGLGLLADGIAADQVVAQLSGAVDEREHRQVGVVATGRRSMSGYLLDLHELYFGRLETGEPAATRRALGG